MTIRAKFLLTFGIILLIITTLLALEYHAAKEEKYYLQRLSWSRSQVMALQELTLEINNYLRIIPSALIHAQNGPRQPMLADSVRTIEEKFVAIEQLLPQKVAFLKDEHEDEESEEEDAYFDNLRQLYAELSANVSQIEEMHDQGKDAAAMHFFHTHTEQHVAKEFLRVIGIWTADEEAEMIAAQQALDRQLSRDNLILISLAALALIAVSSMSLTLVHPILKSLRTLLAGTERIGRGDLDGEVRLEGRDELAQLADSFNRMARNLHESMVSKSYLDNILNSMADTLIVVDAGGAVVSMNTAAEELLGYDLSELAGQPFSLLCPEEHAVAADLNDRDLSKVNKNVERAYRAKDGRKIPVLFSRSLMQDNDGHVQGAVCVALDITIRKAAEQALNDALVKERRLLTELEASHRATAEKNLELETANAELKNAQSQMLQREKMASIGQLAAGVAHEINNPIGFIASNLNTLEKYIDRLKEFIDAQSRHIASAGNASDAAALDALRSKLKLDYILGDARELTAESLDGTDRVSKIVQGLKSFSRVDQAEHKEADINECLESTLNIVWNELKYKAEVRKELGDLPPTRCYPQQLNQVFMNLLVNAAHAIEKQGVITIRTWQQDGSIRISVADTGNGIPEKNLNRLFEPFFTTKEVGKGTGLGLSIAYEIVKKHNGSITVTSREGEGTTFTVTIPVAHG